MKILLAGGVATGEDRYVGGASTGENMPLSREGALARIEALKKDTDWVKKYQAGSVTAKEEWHGLHLIAHGNSRAA